MTGGMRTGAIECMMKDGIKDKITDSSDYNKGYLIYQKGGALCPLKYPKAILLYWTTGRKIRHQREGTISQEINSANM